MDEDFKTVGMEKRETEISRAFKRQKALLSELNDATSALQDKFGPVLMSIPESMSDRGENQGFSTEVARKITDNSEKIQVVLDRVVSMLKRCEL